MAYTTQLDARPQMDATDGGIITERMRLLDEHIGPRVGDFVRFADGVQRRISHIWTDEAGKAEDIQTSDGGSFYLGAGYVSFSGSLHLSVPADSFQRRGVKDGRAWIFHHDHHRAHNGVDFIERFRLYLCRLPAPR